MQAVVEVGGRQWVHLMESLPEIIGWIGAIAGMSVGLPQLFNGGRRVAKSSYYLLLIVYVCYGTAGYLKGSWWLLTAQCWGLMLTGLILYRLHRHKAEK